MEMCNSTLDSDEMEMLPSRSTGKLSKMFCLAIDIVSFPINIMVISMVMLVDQRVQDFGKLQILEIMAGWSYTCPSEKYEVVIFRMMKNDSIPNSWKKYTADAKIKEVPSMKTRKAPEILPLQ